MNNPAFAVGDVVTLVSGGPQMTVTAVDNNGDVAVAWFDVEGFNIGQARLPSGTLLKKASATTADPEPIRSKIAKLTRGDQ
jgi:uncharacterized protein YodC (DUF2158 family)